MFFREKFKNFFSNIWYYVFITVIITIGLFFTLQLSSMKDIAVPFSYSFDSLGVSSDIKNMIDHHNLRDIYYSEDLAAPYGYSSFTSYFIVTLLYWFLYILSGFFHHYGTVLNLAYLFSFYIIAWCSFWALNKLNMNKIYSILGSVLFSFLQYHFYRGEDHLSLSFYWAVPLVCFVLTTLYNTDWCDFNVRALFKTNSFLCCATICLLLGLWDLYYLIFSIILIFCVGFFSILKNRNIKQIYIPILLCLLSVICAVPILFQSFIGSKSLVSSAYSERSIASIELYGLRLIQLLLPIKGHRFSFLSDFRESYDSIINIGTNESSYISLGILISIGFIFSILYIFISNKKTDENTLLFSCGLINILIFFIASIGGISSFIGIITSSIRCYNRMVVFIAFFSIISLGYILTPIIEKIKKWSYLLIIFLCFFGIFDQTSVLNVPNYEEITTAFYEDQTFVTELEAAVPENSMIFEMPLLNATEEYTNTMEHFALYKPYLHSSNLKWLHRFSAGSKTEQMVESMKNMDIYELLDTVYLLGFNGIYIDAKGYDDNQLAYLTGELDSLLSTKNKIISLSGSKIFYSLDNYCIRSNTQSIIDQFYNTWFNLKNYSYTVFDNSYATIYDKNTDIYIGSLHNSDIVTITGLNISVNKFILVDAETKEPIKYDTISFTNHSVQLLINNVDISNAILILKNDLSIKKLSIYSSNEDNRIYADHLNYFGDIAMLGTRSITLKPNSYQYGPYTELDAGSYKITVDGNSLNKIKVDCVTNNGKQSIKTSSLRAAATRITYTITLKEFTDNIEFRLYNNSLNDVTIHYIQIEKMREK